MNDVRREKYQVMPALPAEDYEALKADIAARGVMVAIELDEYGNMQTGSAVRGRGGTARLRLQGT